MTVRTPSPVFLSAMRALQAEGIELGKTDAPQDEKSAAASLASQGYVDVHVGKTVDERLTIKQVMSIEAVHDDNLESLSPTSRQLLADMREVERHDQRFVYYNGQANTLGSYRGEYRAFYQTTIPFAMAFAQIDAGFPYQSGVWGYQPALGIVERGSQDGSIDKYVPKAYLGRADVAYIAETLRRS